MKPERGHLDADTGYGPMDEEHQNIGTLLVGFVEAVGRGAPDESAYFLDSVVDAVTAHFRHEERLMLEHQFPRRDRHKAAHDGFLTDVCRFRKLLAEQGITPDLRRWALGRLDEWFRFHVVANDIELGKYLLSRTANAGPRARAVA